MTKQRGRLVVFMDGECALCRATSNVLEAADRARATDVVSYRENTSYRDHGITAAAASAQLQVLDTTTGEIYGGFEAIRRLAREVPLLWPFRPALWLAAKLGIGDPLYKLIASHRPRTNKPVSTLGSKG